MTERALPLVSVLVAALGCSVLVNTDYSGGTAPSAVNSGGHSGTMIDAAGGILFVSGGTFGESGADGGGQADMPAEGGAGNQPSAAGGSSGFAGAGVSGSGGIEGGAGEAQGGSGADEGAGGST